jgi:glyoxylase-like metal-dependent hydrolase (beta-lactamase superfamily II)
MLTLEPSVSRWIPLLLLSACANGVERHDFGEVEVVTLQRHFNNAHLVRTATATMLFDGGFERDAPALVEALAKEGVEASELALVVVSHHHADHAGGAGYLQRELGVPVLMGEGDAAQAALGENDTLCPTDRGSERRLEETQAETYTPFVPDFSLASGESVDLAAWGLPGAAVSLPGHTPGSLIVDLGEAVLVGDLVRGSLFGHRAERHFYMCDLPDNDADLERLIAELTPSGDTYFVGHFGPLSRAGLQRFVDAHPAPEESP